MIMQQMAYKTVRNVKIYASLKQQKMHAGPDPEHSNTGGHRMPRHDVSGGSRKGGEYERGIPPLI